MSPRARRIAALVAALTLLTSVFVALSPVVTGAPPAGAAGASNSDDDYATVQFSDPWDFSNPADFPGWGAPPNSSFTVANGVLDASSQAGGGYVLTDAIAGSLPHDRSSTLHPVDANTLRKVSFRMWADRNAAGGFFWYSCDHIIPNCENGFPITVRAGWNNYVYDIGSQAAFRSAPAWAGVIKGLRFVPSGGSPIHIMLDYMRVTATTASNVPPDPPVPLPVVDNPAARGGVDYATIARGDPWDMSQPSDIYAPQNMSYGFNGTLLNGLSVANNRDAHFGLPLNGPIDGSRFHRLFFRVFYEGPYSLGFEPGGGMVARLIWETASRPGVWQDSEDIVVYPGWNDISIDLATSPPSAIVDPDDAVRIGWAGQLITAVRFDPHEDIAPRRFLVDDIRLSEDATGYSGAYNIQFHDAAWAPGTTADIYANGTRGTVGGNRIATNIPVDQGINTFRWAPNPVTPGPFWINVVLKRGSYQAQKYAYGPLRMTNARSPLYGVNPLGSLDRATVQPSGVRVQGWALDPETDGPVQVHFYVDGRGAGSTTANTNRPDVQSRFPGFSAAHGYDTVIAVPQGRHSVCAYAINVGAGGNRQLGCRAVNVQNNPIGSLDVVAPHLGYATVRGWTVDPNRTTPINVHIYADGNPVEAVLADQDRPDVARVVPGYGAAHGFQRDIALTSGAHTVCAYGLNEGAGGNALLGCKNVTLRSSPLGSIDAVHSNGSGVVVSGWAIDPDTSTPITVHLYVRGGGVFPVVANATRTDVAAIYPRYGAGHGFAATVPAGGGPHTVCAYGINRGPGGNTLLGCRTG
jgi:hypothetical protein